MDLVKQSYWNNSYATLHLFEANDAITHWLKQFILPAKGELFEVGCYPGRYLAYMGKKGWTVSGMDLSPQTNDQLKLWLHSLNINTNKLEQGDVLSYLRSSNDKYDMVCSFGFIEHFKDFLDIIELHTKIIKQGGKLIITTPHFKGGIQKFLHTWLDNENLQRHYLPSMQPALWAEKLKSLGYTIEWQGYFGNFDFWADKERRNILNKIFLKILTLFSPLFKWLPNSRIYSPYCGIVAIKK